MDTFNTLCNLIFINGRQFGSADLCDISIELGIIAEVSIFSVLEGWNYNRGVRLMDDVLWRLALKGFKQWLEEHHQENQNCSQYENPRGKCWWRFTN